MLPTFLGLGSARCASTWLHNNLCRHPQILMTFEKEISFFGKECLIHDLEWYEQSFRPQKGQEAPQIRGDISPWYARLTRQSVRAVHRVVPDGRSFCLFAIRSSALEPCPDGAGPKSETRSVRVTQWRWIAHFDRLRQWLYGDYERTLKNWSAFFPQRQIQVDLYERVSSDPAGLMRDVLTHIGADPDWTPPQSLTQKIWTISEATNGLAEGIQLPDSLRWHLAKQWLEPTQRLNDRLEGKVDHWVRQMQDITARPVRAELADLANGRSHHVPLAQTGSVWRVPSRARPN